MRDRKQSSVGIKIISDQSTGGCWVRVRVTLTLLRIHMAIHFEEEKVRLYAKRKDNRRIISIGICVGNAKRLFENCIQQCYENTLKNKNDST